MTFREILYAKLGSITEVNSVVNGAIYPGVLPETHQLDRDGPALTYTITALPRNHQLTGSDGTATATVQLSAWSLLLSQSDSITLALFNALDGLVNDSSWGDGSITIRSCLQDDETDIVEPFKEGSDDWIYQLASVYKIKHTVTYPTHS